MLLAEINHEGSAEFFRVNYDGYWEKFKHGTVIAGDSKVSERIQKAIEGTDFMSLDLDKSIQSALRIWEEGRKKPKLEEDANSPVEDNDQAADEAAIPTDLKEAFDSWNLEAAVLNNNTGRKCLYRVLSESEISALKLEMVQ